jgi:hypothetical protein
VFRGSFGINPRQPCSLWQGRYSQSYLFWRLFHDAKKAAKGLFIAPERGTGTFLNIGRFDASCILPPIIKMKKKISRHILFGVVPFFYNFQYHYST